MCVGPSIENLNLHASIPSWRACPVTRAEADHHAAPCVGSLCRTAHWSLTLAFALFTGASAALTTAETAVVKRSQTWWRRWTVSFWIKTTLLVIGLVLVIATIVLILVCNDKLSNGALTSKCDAVNSASAVCEWLVAVIFALYLLTFAYDLWPWNRKGEPAHVYPEAEMEEQAAAMEAGQAGTVNAGAGSGSGATAPQAGGEGGGGGIGGGGGPEAVVV